VRLKTATSKISWSHRIYATSPSRAPPETNLDVLVPGAAAAGTLSESAYMVTGLMKPFTSGWPPMKNSSGAAQPTRRRLVQFEQQQVDADRQQSSDG